MSPEIFFVQMMTGVVPIVIACMIVGAVLGAIVKGLKTVARRAFVPADRRPSRR